MKCSDLISLKNANRGMGEIEKILSYFNKTKNERKPFYLTLDDLDKILIFKLGKQYGRQGTLRKLNTDDNVRKITALAFSIKHVDKEYELEIKLKLLMMLSGVGLPVATAILTVVDPEEYAIIDFRNWRQLYGEKRHAYSIKDYIAYLNKIKLCAKELGWTVQQVDAAIWELDKRTY
ncbi:MAG: hypothetical protein AB7K41_16030 [Bdellovibrionales bacterium]